LAPVDAVPDALKIVHLADGVTEADLRAAAKAHLIA
jgi:hypothetical protein